MLRLLMYRVKWPCYSSGNHDVNSAEFIRSAVVESIKQQKRYKDGVPFPPEMESMTTPEPQSRSRPLTRSQGLPLAIPEDEAYDPKTVTLSLSEMVDLSGASDLHLQQVFLYVRGV